MKDGRIQCLCHVSAVRGRAAVLRIRRVSHLIVDDDVDSASHCVVGQVAHIVRFVHDALTRVRSVSVEEDAHCFGPVVVLGVVLLGSHLAHGHWRHRLEVRRIRQQAQAHRNAAHRLKPERRRSEMILHVARSGVHFIFALDRGRPDSLSELREHLLHRLLYHVGEHIEPSPVGHRNLNLLYSEVSGPIDHAEHARHEGPSAVQAEALGGGKFSVQEIFEEDRPSQPLVNQLLLERRVLGSRRSLDPLQQPILHDRARDVAELISDFVAVNFLEFADQLPDRLGHRNGDDAAPRNVESDLLEHLVRPQVVKLG
mmetsp:Transcript_6374/g.16443  ORF Transcript_6374/g.16443 Transcript_6374/m.16443 type:complete len:313 (+) Transcript_6374:3072-4010(+)